MDRFDRERTPPTWVRPVKGKRPGSPPQPARRTKSVDIQKTVPGMAVTWYQKPSPVKAQTSDSDFSNVNASSPEGLRDVPIQTQGQLPPMGSHDRPHMLRNKITPGGGPHDVSIQFGGRPLPGGGRQVSLGKPTSSSFSHSTSGSLALVPTRTQHPEGGGAMTFKWCPTIRRVTPYLRSESNCALTINILHSTMFSTINYSNMCMVLIQLRSCRYRPN